LFVNRVEFSETRIIHAVDRRRLQIWIAQLRFVGYDKADNLMATIHIGKLTIRDGRAEEKETRGNLHFHSMHARA